VVGNSPSDDSKLVVNKRCRHGIFAGCGNKIFKLQQSGIRVTIERK
jgi:hypothetical protein